MSDRLKPKKQPPDVEQTSTGSCKEIPAFGVAGTKTDMTWMDKAVELARRSGQDVPVGAILIAGGQPIGRGYNQREATGDPTGHAEIIALRQAAAAAGTWRLNGTILYTTLEPCPMCAEAIVQCRVSKLVFGAYDPASGAAGSAFNLFVPGRIFPVPEVIGGVMEQQCRQLLVDFFRGRPPK